MRIIRQLAGAAAALVVSMLAAGQASAANVLIASAETGSGANTCFSFAQACTLNKALSVASPGDVIELVSGGSYFSATIDKEITIFSRAGAFLTGGESPCLTVNAGANDAVTLDGVNCVAESGGSHGILFNTGEKLRFRNGTIRAGVAEACAIFFQPNTNAELNIENSTMTENGISGLSGGVCIVPRSGADVVGVLDRVTLQNNRFGLFSSGGAASPVNILIQNSVISGNVVGVRSSGVGSLLRFSNTSIYRNTTGLFISSNGSLISVGGNVLRANGANGAFTATEAKE